MPNKNATTAQTENPTQKAGASSAELLEAERRALDLLRGGSSRSVTVDVKPQVPLEPMRDREPEPTKEEVAAKEAAEAPPKVAPPSDPDLAARIVNWEHLTPFARRSLEAGSQSVDKYFGTKLPPSCRQSGCYMTDNGKFFYCIDSTCHKDKKRETKYNRRKRNMFYFFCPKCRSRDIQLHLIKSSYECLGCGYGWAK